ncbi:biopolymer transporter ExbD [Citreicella sp. C3M06]|uniref:ExbD/TolR family protein n=1 Tax=Citreicella sp. C3M06 TaxID=2841564 RepID=UPI001C09729E|nr:biopolymer transporter ExbD [Citreicella sp. C3M06]MBU2961787.1 biopolymer transporter ExbD [Citreicella sp. C3M06]
MIRTRRPRSKSEPTIALINIVFLMLIFFLVAGQVAQPLGESLALVRTADLDSAAAPSDALVVTPDGALSLRGTAIASPEAFLAALDTPPSEVRIVPDRDLPAEELVALARALRRGGAEKVIVVTERGLE